MREFSKPWLLSARNLSILVALSLVLFGCEDEGITAADDGELQVDDRVQFSATIVGETETETIEFINDGDVPIRIQQLELVEDPHQPGSHEAFELVDAWEGELDLGTDRDEDHPVTVDVAYTPEDAEPYNALIEVQTNLADDMESFQIPVDADESEAELVAPDTVSLDRVPEGETASTVFQVDNIGTADLIVDDVYVAEGANHYDLSFPTPIDEIDESELTAAEQQRFDNLDEDAETFDLDDPILDVAPGEQMDIRARFEAPDDNHQWGMIHLFTNATNAQPREDINLSANSEAPCLEVADGEVDFELAPIGNTTQETVTVANCSAQTDTELRGVDIGLYDEADDEFDSEADIPFAVEEATLPEELLLGEYLVLEPEETASFVVTYAPEALQEDVAQLELESDDEASPLYADVLGEGTDLECPEANARARVEGAATWSEEEVSAIPLDEIEFDGTESHDPDGTELTFVWAISDSPEGSGAEFDDPTLAEPVLATDIAGNFTVELSVYDEAGIRSCKPATVDLVILPQSDIHVELTWEVLDAEDGTGVDLDLHYLHPAGDWGDAPYGVYYNNTMQNENWNDGSEVYLDIDSLTGAEPENIYHSDPDPNYDYAVGVYYFGDPVNYGETEARVRIYLNNALMFDEVEIMENSGEGVEGQGDFWYVADILVDGAALLLDEIDEMYVDAGFPN